MSNNDIFKFLIITLVGFYFVFMVLSSVEPNNYHPIQLKRYSNVSNSRTFELNTFQIGNQTEAKKIFKNFSQPGQPDWCREQKFRSPPGNITGLISKPGSGNTWLRYLIQQLSGIKTGSFYNDKLLKQSGMAENVRNGEVAVVKSHRMRSRKCKDKYDKIIFLIRNPINASLAEFHRRKGGGHVGFARKRAFKQKKWQKYIKKFSKEWFQIYNSWLKVMEKKNILVVFYEKLQDETETELRRVMRFLDLDFSEEDMECTLERKEGLFKRPKKDKNYFDRYSEEQIQLMDKTKEHLFQVLKDFDLLDEE